MLLNMQQGLNTVNQWFINKKKKLSPGNVYKYIDLQRTYYGLESKHILKSCQSDFESIEPE